MSTEVGSFTHPTYNIFDSEHPILPGATSELSVNLWIKSTKHDENSDFETTVIFVDQYGNEHKVKGFSFRSTKQVETKKVEIQKESIHAISNPIEKEIVAVLKAETDRYRQCGRSVGGLGSVETIYRGEKIIGVGSEGRSASPTNQSIILDSKGELIQSDNVRALLNIYAKCDSLEKQSWFIQAILARLSKHSEYSSIGYIILLVLFRLGTIRKVLENAKIYLQGDQAFGFSDFLRLLDGMLRYEHPFFSDEHLDEVERFVEGLEEHTFRISERLAAIRAYRLAGPKE